MLILFIYYITDECGKYLDNKQIDNIIALENRCVIDLVLFIFMFL